MMEILTLLLPVKVSFQINLAAVDGKFINSGQERISALGRYLNRN